ncbi:ficolin-2-like [Teleopsis dalmanni]|uniref:ficolin-2-like n=1 Tax=Teleopsis dalmanni TaxID=139649 RepID=UPI0018CD1361|nr:ficolin-2-like [Teleopsis dalmanni]XP_037942687.1 ficolin-2-like [Teleopsis dalmanni]
MGRELKELRSIISKVLQPITETKKSQNAENINNNFSHKLDIRSISAVPTKEIPDRTTTEQLPMSCAEAMPDGSKKSGIYKIYLPESDLKPFYVYCQSDPDNSTAWTVVQRREDSRVNFFADWKTYKAGFGNLNGAFFIGLDKLHALTQSELHELWIRLEDFEGETRYAKYDLFAIGDESTQYTLSILGKYSGNAGDSFSSHQGQKFSTKNVDNDITSKNCAERYKSSWWNFDCYDSNLNGEYGSGYKNYTGINWKTWHGIEYSLKGAIMAIRPSKS